MLISVSFAWMVLIMWFVFKEMFGDERLVTSKLTPDVASSSNIWINWGVLPVSPILNSSIASISMKQR